MTKTVATVKPLLTNPVSGRIVCVSEITSDCCAGMTLIAAYKADPTARGWLGINGEPYVRLDDESERELRSFIPSGPICDCVGSE